MEADQWLAHSIIEIEYLGINQQREEKHKHAHLNSLV